MPLLGHPLEQHDRSDLRKVLAEHHHGALVTQDVPTVVLILFLHVLHFMQVYALIDYVRQECIIPHEIDGLAEVSIDPYDEKVRNWMIYGYLLT